LPLFVDSGPARAIENRNHDPITRFSFWTETGLAPHAKPLVREWQSWIADAAVDVSEVRRARQLDERDRATAPHK
jgi:hypothetical protein